VRDAETDASSILSEVDQSPCFSILHTEVRSEVSGGRNGKAAGLLLGEVQVSGLPAMPKATMQIYAKAFKERSGMLNTKAPTRCICMYASVDNRARPILY
jgi:hypothetical protein